MIGPSSLIIWVLAGLMAMVIALSFARCVTLLPRVGGPYAYARAASTPSLGFMVGWALLLSEWFSLAVFPVAFAQYFCSMVPGIDALGQVFLKAFFIVFVLATNVVGIKAAGRANDALTIAKLAPLVLIIVGGASFVLGNPSIAGSNLLPFFTGDLSGLGSSLVLIFWAYAGFELSTLPADEVEEPERTIPRAIVMGMLIVMAFYLLTNLMVITSVDQSTLALSPTPLLDSAESIFGGFPAIVSMMVLLVGVGALLSIVGADESGTIGTTRLVYAMSLDGLLPHAFSRQHKRYKTPYLALAVLCATALVVSVVGGLSALISASVFLLALVYLATCLSALRLGWREPEKARRFKGGAFVPLAGAAFSLLLIVLVSPEQILVSLALLAIGIPVYTFFSPKQELAALKAEFVSSEAVLKRAYAQRKRFLAWAVNLVKLLIYRIRGMPPAWLESRASRRRER